MKTNPQQYFSKLLIDKEKNNLFHNPHAITITIFIKRNN